VDYYNHADKLDSVIVMAESDGDQAESYRYKEYGEQTVVDSSFTKLSVYASNIGNWKRYTGQEHALPSSFGDPWYFYRARVYRADAGRFVQRDPLRLSDGPNGYAYVLDSPLGHLDPLGLTTIDTGPAYEDYNDCMKACAENPGEFDITQRDLDDCVSNYSTEDCKSDNNYSDAVEKVAEYYSLCIQLLPDKTYCKLWHHYEGVVASIETACTTNLAQTAAAHCLNTACHGKCEHYLPAKPPPKRPTPKPEKHWPPKTPPDKLEPGKLAIVF